MKQLDSPSPTDSNDTRRHAHGVAPFAKSTSTRQSEYALGREKAALRSTDVIDGQHGHMATIPDSDTLVVQSMTLIYYINLKNADRKGFTRHAHVYYRPLVCAFAPFLNLLPRPPASPDMSPVSMDCRGLKSATGQNLQGLNLDTPFHSFPSVLSLILILAVLISLSNNTMC